MKLTTKDDFEALRAAYRDAFNTPLGRRVMDDLDRFCRMYNTTYVPSERDSANLEGRRSVALYIRAMQADNDDLLRALGLVTEIKQ